MDMKDVSADDTPNPGCREILPGLYEVTFPALEITEIVKPATNKEAPRKNEKRDHTKR